MKSLKKNSFVLALNKVVFRNEMFDLICGFLDFVGCELVENFHVLLLFTSQFDAEFSFK